MGRHRKPVTADSERNYPVGYCRPPKKTAFKKGQIGNPNGRPRKRASTPGEELEAVLNQTIEVRQGDAVSKMTYRKAIFSAQAAKAMKGDTRAAEFLLRQRDRYRDDPGDRSDQTDATPEDRKIIDDFIRDFHEGNKTLPDVPAMAPKATKS
jgi:hypothetical protein